MTNLLSVYSQFLGSLLACIVLWGCQEPVSTGTPHNGIDTAGISSSGAVLLQGTVVVIPPPAMLSGIIRKKELPYHQNLSASSLNPREPANELELALQLGMFGADLTYLMNYDQHAESALCLARVKALAERLDLMAAVDSSLIAALEHGQAESGAWLGLHSELFRAFERHIHSRERPQISNGILIGGWIESLHLLAGLSDSLTTLDDYLAEQRYSAAGILRLAKAIHDPIMDNLLPTLTPLCDAFSELGHRYSYRDPMHDKREHISYLRSESVVDYSPEQIENLHVLIEAARKQLLTP